MSYHGKLLIGKEKNSYGDNLYFDSMNEGGNPPPSPPDRFILLENGSFMLLENGFKIKLELGTP